MTENRKKRSNFGRLAWTALAIGSSSVAAKPYINDHQQHQHRQHNINVQQSMDSMSPVERFLYNQNVVHTFDTVESCSRKCPRQCLVQEVADLMMPRYICPQAKGTLSSELSPISTIRGNRDLNEDLLPFSSQYLLILVPLSMLILVVLLIVWCRKCSNNNNSSLD